MNGKRDKKQASLKPKSHSISPAELWIGLSIAIVVAWISSPVMAAADTPSPSAPLPFVHPIFASHMVLQRDAEDPVWGWATPGTTVSVMVKASGSPVPLQKKTAIADSNGHWQISVGPFPASNQNLSLIIASRDKPTVTLTDILMGDVWLCSGQSNMARSLAHHNGIPDIPNQDAEIADTINYPLIRQYYLANLASAQPQLIPTAITSDETGSSGPWLVNNPVNASQPSRYTAVGYFFARQLHRALHVPIGIVQMSWGGTSIEAWIDPVTLSQDPNFPKTAIRPADSKAGTCSAIYNGKVATITPFKFKGVVWYQGENNERKPEQYSTLLPLLFKSWRQNFQQPELPFIVIQLPNYKNNDWAILRDAQLNAVRNDPHSRLVVTIDLGDAAQLHPADKQDVGTRAARAALDLAYGRKLVASGPLLTQVAVKGNTFQCEFAQVGAGLMVGSREVPPVRPDIPTAEATSGTLTGFEISGADGEFHPATAVITGRATVDVSSPEVIAPVSVRYAWAGAPACNLYNKIADADGNVIDGLPASPFRFPY